MISTDQSGLVWSSIEEFWSWSGGGPDKVQFLRRPGGGLAGVRRRLEPTARGPDQVLKCRLPVLPLQVVYFGDSMRSDMFPASSFAKWETVMIAEEMEGEGVAKSDAALNNEAQVEPLEKKVKFEVSLAAVCAGPRASAGCPAASSPLPVSLLHLTAGVSFS